MKDICITEDNEAETLQMIREEGREEEEDRLGFLDYVGERSSENGFVKKLEEEVSRAKQNREWRREYMTLLMRDQENLERGIQQGEERLAVLTKRLLQEKRYDALERISDDGKYRQTLYEEYHII